MRGGPGGTGARGGPGGIDYASDAEIDSVSTGLTLSGGVLTSNLSTGVAGGQSAIGGTAAGENLTLSSTTNATKGKVLFGTHGAYDEANGRLGVGTQSPTDLLDFRHPTSLATLRLDATTDNATNLANFSARINGSGIAALTAYGSNFTPSGALKAAGARVAGLAAGGLSVVASHASGDVRVYAGGAADGDLQALFTGGSGHVLYVDNTAALTIETDRDVLVATQLGIGDTPSYPFHTKKSVTSGNGLIGEVQNTGTGAAAHATWSTRVAGATAGDPRFWMVIDGVKGWNLGVDNSDSDKFSISDDSNGDVGANVKLQLAADADTADTETCLLLRRNVGAAFSVVRVSMGAADSGGAGFKLLRVPN